LDLLLRGEGDDAARVEPKRLIIAQKGEARGEREADNL